ncbi:unnamed protein product [Brassica oleracea]
MKSSLVITLAGKWCVRKSFSTSSLKILYSIGATRSCLQNGCTMHHEIFGGLQKTQGP